MSSKREGRNYTYSCDRDGCAESVTVKAPGYKAAWEQIGAKGWQARNYSGEFKHFCCDMHAEAQWRVTPAVGGLPKSAIVWKDGTMHYRGDDGTQKVWRADLGRFSIVLVRDRKFYEGKWIADFQPVFEDRVLGEVADIGVADAQQRAINLARKALEPAFKALDSAASTAFCDDTGAA